MFSPSQKNTPRSIFLVLILVAIFCASCNLPAGLEERILGTQEEVQPTPVPTFTPQPLPPAIVETDPAQGSTISLGEEITIYFNQDINPESALGALSADPDIEAALEWLDPSTLVYRPVENLPAGSTIQIHLDESLQAANGLLLPEPLRLVYYTPDLLKPVTFLPSPGSYEIDPESAILVTFNQPVVPLGDQRDSASPAFLISPNVNGKGEWLNTSTYQFLPDPGLAGGTTYQVSLSSSITSMWGTGLDPEIDTGWSFSTSYPQVISSSPYQGDAGVPLDEGIRIEFNQAMNQESVGDFFSIIGSAGRPVPGAFDWDEDNKAFTYQADELYFRDSTYSVLLPGEAESAGGTPLALDTGFSFSTTGDFRFLGTPQGQNYATSIYQGATLYFNNPVDRETVEENISISPEVANLYPSSGDSSNVLNLYGDLEPLTTYTLTLREGLADIWGSELGGARVIQFTTEALPPNLTISQGSSVLYLTGSENVIPAVGTNLYQVSINIGSVPEDDLDQFFGGSLYQALEDYFPGNARAWTEVVTVPGDDKYSVNLPLNEAGSSLAPGVYRYQIYSQELPYNPSPYLLAVSNIHLTMKTSPENLLVWALDLRTGQPVSDLDLKIYNPGGEVLITGTTNQDGVYLTEFGPVFDLYKNVFYVVSGKAGEDDFGLAASNWGFGTEPYNFGLSSDYGTPRPQTYIYTDRPIYRPGQTVYYRLIHRDRADGAYKLPESSDLPVTLHLSGGKEENLTLQLSDYGTANGEIQLSPFADPGYYRIEAENGMVFFQVAAYRKPEIKLDVSLNLEETLGGDDIQGEVAAAYYFDAPADELSLDWSLRAFPTNFYLPGYQVGVLGSTWFEYSGIYGPNIWGTRIASGEGETNEAGEWDLTQKLELMNVYDRKVELPAVYTLEVTAQDETGFQVSDRSDVFVHPSEFYIGVKPSAWMTIAEESVDFGIQVVDWEKSPVGVKELTAEFSKVTWSHSIGEIGEIEYTREKDLVATLEIRTTNRGEASVSFTPPEPGTYQLDIFGGGARTEVTLWVGGAWSYGLAHADQSEDQTDTGPNSIPTRGYSNNIHTQSLPRGGSCSGNSRAT